MSHPHSVSDYKETLNVRRRSEDVTKKLGLSGVGRQQLTPSDLAAVPISESVVISPRKSIPDKTFTEILRATTRDEKRQRREQRRQQHHGEGIDVPEVSNSAAVTLFHRANFIPRFRTVFHIFMPFTTRIEQRFGSSVAGYFRLLRYLVKFQFFFFLLWLGMVLVPWWQHQGEVKAERKEAPLSEAIIGNVKSNMTTGWWYYSDFTPEMAHNNMPLLYTVAILATYGLSCLILMQSTGSHILHSVRSVESMQQMDMAVLLWSWDWNIRDIKSARNLMLGFRTHLHALMQSCHKVVRTRHPRVRRAIAWILSACVLCVTLFITYTVAINLNSLNDSSRYLAPAILTLLNLLVPPVMRHIVSFEKISDPQRRVYSELFRVYCIKMAGVVFLVFQTSQLTVKVINMCSEKAVGEMYIQLLVLNYGVEYAWTIVVEIGLFLCRGAREFLPSLEMMEVYYRIAIVFIAVPYSPMMFCYGAVLDFGLFFLKYNIVQRTCCPPREPTRAGQNQAAVRGLLLCTVLLAAIPTVKFLQSDTTQCGPHVIYGTPLSAISEPLSEHEGVVIVTYWVFHPIILFPCCLLLAAGNYFLLMLSGKRAFQNDLQVAELELVIKDLRTTLVFPK
eukprot:PhF_6_TR37232/c0_g1_i1/m.54932/K21988/TMC; transmembrane channel-like protein